MGEIGYNEDRFLYKLKLWQIKSIIRGYRRRSRESWMQTRWQTWVILRAVGSKIDSPEDLLQLPFDHKEKTEQELRQEEEQLAKLIEECQEENKRATAQQQSAHAPQTEEQP